MITDNGLEYLSRMLLARSVSAGHQPDGSFVEIPVSDVEIAAAADELVEMITSLT